MGHTLYAIKVGCATLLLLIPEDHGGIPVTPGFSRDVVKAAFSARCHGLGIWDHIGLPARRLPPTLSLPYARQQFLPQMLVYTLCARRIQVPSGDAPE